jgi:hypothetical protein
MSLLQICLSNFAKVALLGVLCLNLRTGVMLTPQSSESPRMRSLPHRVLWAWERREDLHAIDPSTTAIAALDRTILIGPRTADARATAATVAAATVPAATVTDQPQRNAIAYPAGVQRIAVVRIETARIETVRIEAVPGTVLAAAEPQVLSLLLESAAQPGVAALQVDFDATRSQREFYRTLLRDLRAQMPQELPLSITALASWCSYDDWISELPVDEAVPMLFRMEPDRRRRWADRTELQIREPKCRSSLGLSTREEWPEDLEGKRIYLFPDRGWSRDLASLTERKLP